MTYNGRPDHLARRAYEAYLDATSGGATIDHERAWFDLDPMVREAWRQVAKALTVPTTRGAA